MTPDAAKPDFMTEVRKLRDCLRGVDFLYHLKVDELDKLMSALKKRTFPAGATIITQGAAGDAFYMVASGKVSVWVKAKQIKTIGPDQYFGESALVTEEPRSATVKAEEASLCYILYKEDFKKILMANPGIAESIRLHVAKIRTEKH